MLRRLDLYISRRTLSIDSESELWALIMQIAQNAIIDKARITKRLRTTEGEDSELAHTMLVRLDAGDSESGATLDLQLGQLFDQLVQDVDQQILWLWLSGHDHDLISEVVGIQRDAARKRWQRIRNQLKRYLEHAEE